jgi:hypothetical protein
MLVQKTESNAFLFWQCFAIPGTLETLKTTVVVVLLSGEVVQPDIENFNISKQLKNIIDVWVGK